jgi:hypothetical protein
MSETPRKRKPTKEQIRQRIEEILRIRLDGAEIWDTREYVREKEQEPGSPWELLEGQKPLSDSQLWRYMARADKLISESCRASRKKLLRRHLAQRRNLFAKSVSQGDMRAALACLDSEAKLCGLFDDEINRMLEQLQKEIAEIKAATNGNRSPTQATDADAGRVDSDSAPGTGDAPATAG